MTNKIEDCPFCGHPAENNGMGYIWHQSFGCPIDGQTFNLFEWNNRTISKGCHCDIDDHCPLHTRTPSPTKAECEHVFGTTGAQNHICMKCGEKDASWYSDTSGTWPDGLTFDEEEIQNFNGVEYVMKAKVDAFMTEIKRIGLIK